MTDLLPIWRELTQDWFYKRVYTVDGNEGRLFLNYAEWEAKRAPNITVWYCHPIARKQNDTTRYPNGSRVVHSLRAPLHFHVLVDTTPRTEWTRPDPTRPPVAWKRAQYTIVKDAEWSKIDQVGRALELYLIPDLARMVCVEYLDIPFHRTKNVSSQRHT